MMKAEEFSPMAFAMQVVHRYEAINGERPEEECARLLEWCEKARTNAFLVELFLQGKVDVRWDADSGEFLWAQAGAPVGAVS